MNAEQDASSREARVGDVIADYLLAVREGRAPDRTEILSRHRDLAADLEEFFANHDRLQQAAQPMRVAGPGGAVEPSPQSRTGPGATTETMVLPVALPDHDILEELGRGGMGVVYKARQKGLGRLVAVKMMSGGCLLSGADLRRFHTEIAVVARLDHPNIVPLYAAGEHPGEAGTQPYFSMKLIDGGSLAEVRRVQRGADTPQGANVPAPHIDRERQRWAARLVATVARAVHYAHERGVLHRDLKPANILLDADGEPHVTDFGLARVLGGERTTTGMGAIVGTPCYMAPEQALGDSDLTPAVDVYALGAVLYELLTGRPPFRGTTALETLRQVIERDPVPPTALDRGIDRGLEVVCLTCLRKEPGRRYASAAALADDLEGWLEDRPIRARRFGPTARLWRWCRRNRVAVVLLLVLIGLLSFEVIAGYLHRARVRHAAEAREVSPGGQR
jgi:serine/threonine-protein kinase